MKLILLPLLIAPIFCAAQVYKFNRQMIVHFVEQKTRNIDVWVTPIEVEVTTKKIILRRPQNGSGEQEKTDTLTRSKTTTKKDFKKIITKDGRTVIIWSDQYITIVTKEAKGARTEYVFYNQENKW